MFISPPSAANPQQELSFRLKRPAASAARRRSGSADRPNLHYEFVNFWIMIRA
jgi:hypothetical protein